MEEACAASLACLLSACVALWRPPMEDRGTASLVKLLREWLHQEHGRVGTLGASLE